MDDELRFKNHFICRPDMDAKSTENGHFSRGTGKDFVLQFIKLTFIYTQIYSLCYICLMFGNKRENEMQRSAGTILCCLATASDKNTTISTKYDKYP